MKMKTTSYTVTPLMRYSKFPVDMLRYDRAWPDGSRDAATIEEPVQSRLDTEKVQVHLTGVQRPTIERWNSFGWIVSEERP